MLYDIVAICACTSTCPNLLHFQKYCGHGYKYRGHHGKYYGKKAGNGNFMAVKVGSNRAVASMYLVTDI